MNLKQLLDPTTNLLVTMITWIRSAKSKQWETTEQTTGLQKGEGGWGRAREVDRRREGERTVVNHWKGNLQKTKI